MITVQTAKEKKGLFGTHLFHFGVCFAGQPQHRFHPRSRGLTQAEQQSRQGLPTATRSLTATQAKPRVPSTRGSSASWASTRPRCPCPAGLEPPCRDALPGAMRADPVGSAPPSPSPVPPRPLGCGAPGPLSRGVRAPCAPAPPAAPARDTPGRTLPAPLLPGTAPRRRPGPPRAGRAGVAVPAGCRCWPPWRSGRGGQGAGGEWRGSGPGCRWRSAAAPPPAKHKPRPPPPLPHRVPLPPPLPGTPRVPGPPRPRGCPGPRSPAGVWAWRASCAIPLAVWNLSTGEPTASLGGRSQCSATLNVKQFFLMLRKNILGLLVL